MEPDDDSNLRCNQERIKGWEQYRKETTLRTQSKRRCPKLQEKYKRKHKIKSSTNYTKVNSHENNKNVELNLSSDTSENNDSSESEDS